MDECNSHCMYPNLSANMSNDLQFRLNKRNEIKDYFIAEISERELMSKYLSRYIASFEYLDKPLTDLSVGTCGISIASFSIAIGVPVGIMSASCSPAFSITTGFVKMFLKTRNKKKKHNKIVMLAVSKLNSIDSKLNSIMTILNEEKKYRQLKESIRMMNSQRSDVEKLV